MAEIDQGRKNDRRKERWSRGHGKLREESKTGDELQVEWAHDARNDEECGNTVRDMEQRGDL